MKKLILAFLVLLAPSAIWSDMERCLNYISPAAAILNWYGDWFVTADYLLWKGREDGLDFAFDSTLQTTPTAFLAPAGNLHYPRFRWDSGFRVGAGYGIRCLRYDLYVNYTWFRTKATGFAGPQPGKFLTPRDGGIPNILLAGAIGTVPLVVGSMSSCWRLKLDVVDGELGRSFCTAKCFRLRLHAGLRAAWTRDTMKIDIFDTSDAFAFNQKQRQILYSIGPRMGINAKWGLGHFCGFWYLFGNGAVSLLWSRYHVHVGQSQPATAALPNFFPSLEQRFNAIRSFMDLALGFGWEKPICCGAYYLGARFNWEHHLFAKHNQWSRFTGTNSFGSTISTSNNDTDLSFYGIAISFFFGF